MLSHGCSKENKKIVNSNYDRALAVKCLNGTFVEKEQPRMLLPIRAFPLWAGSLSATCAEKLR